jgi:hypothetical protein
MSGKKKSAPNNINIVKDSENLSGKDLADLVNTYFLSVIDDLPSLDLTSLPSCHPAPKPVPLITPKEVCTYKNA